MNDLKESLQELIMYKRRARYMLGKLHREMEELTAENLRLATKIEALQALLKGKKQ